MSHCRFTTRKEATPVVREYIGTFYKRRRHHCRLLPVHLKLSDYRAKLILPALPRYRFVMLVRFIAEEKALTASQS
ncbi:hypothetical protein HYF16_004771 [Salmonella enterica]|nr:hypothetical protein [Salmonella enterica]EHF6859863.1 hypothetical protein [Salmonella enterica subsp. enterica serovar Panama]